MVNTSYKRLRRTSAGRMLAGVCAGLGAYANLDPTVIRLMMVLLVFLTGPGIILAYLLMALIIPDESTLPRE